MVLKIKFPSFEYIRVLYNIIQMEKNSENSKCQGRNDFASLNVQRNINNKKHLKVCVFLEFLYKWKMVLTFKVF